MKQGIMGIGLVFTLILVVTTVMALGTEYNMQDTLDRNVSMVVYQSLEEYKITSGDLEEITRNYIYQIMDEEKIKQADIQVFDEEEFLSLQITMEYTNFGTKRVVTSNRCALIERKEL